MEGTGGWIHGEAPARGSELGWQPRASRIMDHCLALQDEGAVSTLSWGHHRISSHTCTAKKQLRLWGLGPNLGPLGSHGTKSSEQLVVRKAGMRLQRSPWHTCWITACFLEEVSSCPCVSSSLACHPLWLLARPVPCCFHLLLDFSSSPHCP